ncbi:MAG: hypothetical protein KatS3mg102_2062 [Planctomycetota bacterium]|nr:MAG: hypothetical protein KatS3mg102_2062 [Planctomycetota bacterium]
MPASTRMPHRRRACSPALLASLLAGAAVAALPVQARAGEYTATLALQRGEVQLTIAYEGEEHARWAEVVAEYVREGLPRLERAAGFPYPYDQVAVRLDLQRLDTRGLDAAHLGEGRFAIAKQGKRGGMRGHQVWSALGHAFGARVSSEPWLQQALGYLYTFEALREAHWVYHAWTFRDEVIEDAIKAGRIVCAEWRPAGEVAGLAADGPPAVGFAMLCCAEVELGAGKVREAARVLAERPAPGSVGEFIEALGSAAGKPARAYFVGWAFERAGEDPEPALGYEDFSDRDDDGLLAIEERRHGTDSANPDTDGDGRLDGEEVHDWQSDPLRADPPLGPVTFDGDPKEWLRLKKFKLVDKPGDSRSTERGTELRACALACDQRFLYLLVEADAMDNPKVKYNLALDPDGDGVWDWVVGLRSSRERWLGVTHNQKDWSWAEWRNDRTMALWVKDRWAEMRIPLAAMRGLGERPVFMLYTTVPGPDGATVYADSCLRERFDMARWRLER